MMHLAARLFVSVMMLVSTSGIMKSAAHGADSDGFVFPVLGITQTDPAKNTKNPLSDGWGGNGVGWYGSGLIGHLGQDYFIHDPANLLKCSPSAADKPVYAASRGKVIRVDDDPDVTFGHVKGWGPYILIKHIFPPGFAAASAVLDKSTNRTPRVVYTLYGHLKKGSTLVKIGDNVEKGQQIAQIGTIADTGKWSCSHLHFEIRTNTDVDKGYSGVMNSAPNRYTLRGHNMRFCDTLLTHQ